MKKNDGDGRRPAVVLGQEYGKALEAEERRLRGGDLGASPVPASGYDAWRHETSLLDPVPVPLDATLSEACRTFAASNPADRVRLSRAISMSELYTLMTFSRRAAVFGMRERSVDWIRDSLRAIAMIELERVDYRDVTWALSIVAYAADRIGQDVGAMFSDSAALAEPRLAAFIRQHRRHDARGGGPLFYREVETANGVGLVREGWSDAPYDPTVDMVRLAQEIADVVETDIYGAAEIEICTRLPEVWLRVDRDEVRARPLRDIRAGATIRAHLRPAEGRDHENQMFIVFINEVSGTEDAHDLQRLSVDARRQGSPIVGVASGCIFCLVVGRSVKQDVPSFETPTSLERFVSPITGILTRYTDSSSTP